MKLKACLLLVAVAALPFAAAGYGEGSSLEVASPANIEGQADTLLPAGIASFVSPTSNAPVVVRITADTADLRMLTDDANCAPGVPTTGIPPPPGTCASGPGATSTLLRDATIIVVKPLSAFKVVVTTDRQYADTTTWSTPGDLVVTTGGTTRLGTNAQARYLAFNDNGWNENDARRAVAPYTASADSAEFTASGGVFRAVDGFETLLQGVQIQVTGTDAEGKSYSQTFDTRAPSDASEPVKALVIEVSGGDLQATSSAPFTGYAPATQRPITDVHNRAKFDTATGTVEYAGDQKGPKTFTDSPVTLDGPLSLRLDKVEGGRLTYTISDGLQLGALADQPEKDEPIPPEALAAAGAAGAGGAGLLIALAYFWPRLKYAWTLAFLPMYTRIERDAVLEHEKRDELYELIRVAPGIHAHEIGEKARIGWGTTVYHLKLLENHGLIVSKKTGRYKRFFVNTGEYTKKKDLYGALRNETAKSVADYVVNHPGTTQKELCAALGIQPSLASWHVEKLEGVELVKRVKDGRMVRYFAGPAWADLNVRVNPLGGADAPAET